MNLETTEVVEVEIKALKSAPAIWMSSQNRLKRKAIGEYRKIKGLPSSSHERLDLNNLTKVSDAYL